MRRTSDSGFRAEVESEQALARGQHLLAMIDEYEHTQLGGPAAAEAQRRLAEFSDQARYAGTVLTDARRLARLMRRQDPAIYPGLFATCVFQPDKALCQQHRDSHGTTRPGLGDSVGIPSTGSARGCRDEHHTGVRPATLTGMP